MEIITFYSFNNMYIKPITFLFFILWIAPFTVAQEKITHEMINSSRTLRSLMQSDPHRPIYHFVAPEGHAYPFDPNGGVFWKGKYHLGYIYQKEREGKMEHVWGHAVSTDLFHWSLYPDMLTVKTGDIEKGIFSGGAFLAKNGVPHIMYHGEGSSSNLVAYSTDDDLKIWNKFEGNPVLASPAKDSPEFGKYTAWDPEGWYDQASETYYQISGGNPAGLFKSKDMYTWTYLGHFIDQDKRINNRFEDLSCPDFFKMKDKNVLVFISHYMGTQYYIGTFKNDKYVVEKHGRMNWPGGTFFAPEQLVDDKGRNIIWGWILERKPSHLPDYGWSGIMSLPRVLTLSDENEMLISPPKEVEKLRLNRHVDNDMHLNPHEEKALSIQGKALNISLEIEYQKQSVCGVKVFCSPDNQEETIIKYDPKRKELVVDFKQSSVKAPVKMQKYCMMHYPPTENAEGEVSEQRAPLDLKPGEKLKLNLFIDKSVIEVFANGKQCITQVVYPELPLSNNVKVFSGDGEAYISNIEAWEMAETNSY